jgi:hypothetical protein
MSREALEESVLQHVRRGPVEPAELVRTISEEAGADPKAVRIALRSLVENRSVGLNWHGKFEASAQHSRS